MDKPQYQKKPIAHIDSLAKLLSVDTNKLVNLADQADSFYYLSERIEKPDGSFRDVYGVRDELKILQQQIVNKIYSNVRFPNYLYGSIKGTNHIMDAYVHAHAQLLVKMDISNFFPTLTSKNIFNIWKRFFNFSEPVAKILTKLTTFNNFLPQGAPTSPGLANLAFWDIESAIVDRLQRNGFTYTRFVDDVTVSSKSRTEMHKLNTIFKSVFGMFRSKGVKANRKKTNISTSGYRMAVHNLNINSGTPTISTKKRSQIRSAVRGCEKSYQDQKQSEDYKKLWESAIGRVNYLSQFHPTQAQALHKRLQAVLPVS
ncbi:MAG: RNA-directed DNA polymerase [Anaerolineae bacterium]|nr:RNA-directed DNA polymerase [Anaerolineae bacterium]